MSSTDFIDREFHKKPDSHKDLKRVDWSTLDLSDPRYEWKYYGQEKYGRYAFCDKTKTKRSLTMGEFYGAGVVD